MKTKKKTVNYFDLFADMSDSNAEASALLKEIVYNYNREAMPERIKEMHAIEHAADIKKHILNEALVKEFLPPIERDDINTLASLIDDITDAIEDVALRFYMFDIKEMRAEALQFIEIVIRCCTATKAAIVELKNFKKSTTLKELLIAVNTAEEDGDELYMNSIHKLFTDGTSLEEVLKWRETFQRFERCCDAMEDVADCIESIILKNN